jgi:hypothetical protein
MTEVIVNRPAKVSDLDKTADRRSLRPEETFGPDECGSETLTQRAV